MKAVNLVFYNLCKTYIPSRPDTHTVFLNVQTLLWPTWFPTIVQSMYLTINLVLYIHTLRKYTYNKPPQLKEWLFITTYTSRFTYICTIHYFKDMSNLFTIIICCYFGRIPSSANYLCYSLSNLETFFQNKVLRINI